MSKVRFNRIAKRYKVQNPQAVKMKILWVHIQALVAQTYEVQKPDSPGRKLLQQYQADWREAEMAETQNLASIQN